MAWAASRTLIVPSASPCATPSGRAMPSRLPASTPMARSSISSSVCHDFTPASELANTSSHIVPAALGIARSVYSTFAISPSICRTCSSVSSPVPSIAVPNRSLRYCAIPSAPAPIWPNRSARFSASIIPCGTSSPALS